MFIFSGIVFAIFIVFLILDFFGYIKKDNIVFYLFCLFGIVLITELSLAMEEERKSIPVMTFTIVDKKQSISCTTSYADSCKDAYILILKTNTDYIFSQEFTPNTYYKFNIGDKISYKPDVEVYRTLQ